MFLLAEMEKDMRFGPSWVEDFIVEDTCHMAKTWLAHLSLDCLIYFYDTMRALQKDPHSHIMELFKNHKKPIYSNKSKVDCRKIATLGLSHLYQTKCVLMSFSLDITMVFKWFPNIIMIWNWSPHNRLKLFWPSCKCIKKQSRVVHQVWITWLVIWQIKWIKLLHVNLNRFYKFLLQEE